MGATKGHSGPLDVTFVLAMSDYGIMASPPSASYSSALAAAPTFHLQRAHGNRTAD